MKNIKINHLAVLVCVILLHILGAFWYGSLFLETWTGMVGLDTQNPPQAGISLWIMNFIAVVARVYMLSWILTKLDVTSGIRGAAIAFLLTFSLHHLQLMSGNMFAGEPYGLAWIMGGYGLVGLTICGFILGSWIKRDA